MKNKKMTKAVAVAAASLAMIGVLGTSFAYLTDSKSVDNNFTVGKVTIEENEPSWDGDKDDVLPTESFAKDPQIKNTGDNDAYVYLEVSVPRASVIYANKSGARQNEDRSTAIELFEFDATGKTTQTLEDGIGTSEQNDGWTLMTKKIVGDNAVYSFCYNKVLAPEETSAALFDKITFANVIEGEGLEDTQKTVNVRAYAIQTLNTGDDGASVVDQAKAAWAKYGEQNVGQTSAVVNKEL